MNVLLLHPPAPESAEQRPENTHPSPGLALLAAVLKGEGHRVTALDLAHLHLGDALVQVQRIQRALRPDLVGIGFLTFNRGGAYQTVAALRDVDPGCPIVLGGRHATFQWAQLLERLPVDYVLCGEAELSLPALVSALESSVVPDGIPGLARRKDGVAECRPGQLLVEDLDRLPFPGYDLLEGAPRPAEREGPEAALDLGLMVETRRGCPGRCTFCQSPSWARGPIRRRSVSRVVDQLEQHHRQLGHSFFSLADDTFGDDPAYAEALADALSERGLPIRFGASTRPDAPLTPALLAKLHRAGLVGLHIGAESGSASILRAMGKQCRVDETERLFLACREAGIATRMLLITGFPGETSETLEETVALVQRARPDGLNLYPPILLPGTALYRRALREGLVSEDDWMRPDPELLYLAETDLEALRAMREQVMEALGDWPRDTERSRDLMSRGLRERLEAWLRSPGCMGPDLSFQRLVLDDQGRLKVVLARRRQTLVVIIEDRRGAGPTYLTTEHLALSYQNDPRHSPEVLTAAVRHLADALKRLDGEGEG